MKNKESGIDHTKHNKKRLYSRDQKSGAKAWCSTDLFLCECGAVLQQRYDQVLNKEEVKE